LVRLYTGIYSQKGQELDKSKIYKQLTWGEFIAMKQEAHTPGISTPFDPVAALEAQRNNITAVILNGNNLGNFRSYLEGNEFEGTIISSGKNP